MTETINAVSMITKAGVPSNNVVVRVTNYGRSFRMTDPGWTLNRRPGYISNAEVNEIIAASGNDKTTDMKAGSDILIHDDYEWFAYMDAEKYHIAGSVVQFAPCIPPQECDKYGKLIGAPALRPGFQIPNPKDSIEKSLGNLRELAGFVSLTAAEVDAGLFLEPTADAVDATAMPVLMVRAAVEAMKSIYEMGEEIQQKQRENIILLALTAILFIIPGLGQAASAVTGLAVFARIAVVIAELGGAALGAYDIAQNPDSAPMGVLGILLGGLAIRGAFKGFVSEAATLRRGMSARQIEGLGPAVKEGLDKIGSVVTRVCNL
ncbi:glycosylhydrolase family 18-Jun [Colletotrichum higginsianum]|nr:glycosylhydrolase family 18-Jun [Colletotrichum higginsianum]